MANFLTEFDEKPRLNKFINLRKTQLNENKLKDWNKFQSNLESVNLFYFILFLPKCYL